SILRDPDEAEDLAQEVFLDLARKGGYDARRGSLGGFLATMTRSRALDRLRSRRRRGELLSEFAGSVPQASAAPSPLDRLADDETARRTREALAALPERYRRVIELAYFEGLSQSEIAAALDAPLGTVKTWARMGLRALRDSLNDLIGTER
ncbi:MAG: sigma-70 family RNA polymerase sigma factor, partial [Candidatus Eisenbacteria bacterium]